MEIKNQLITGGSQVFANEHPTPTLGEQLQEAEIKGARAGFLAALKYMQDKELPMAFKEAFSDRPDHFHKHMMRKLDMVSWGDRSDFYRTRIDEDCQNLILSHYLAEE